MGKDEARSFIILLCNITACYYVLPFSIFCVLSILPLSLLFILIDSIRLTTVVRSIFRYPFAYISFPVKWVWTTIDMKTWIISDINSCPSEWCHILRVCLFIRKKLWSQNSLLRAVSQVISAIAFINRQPQQKRRIPKKIMSRNAFQ